MRTLDLSEFYSILGVTESTPLSEIRLARKRLLSEVHPDRFDSKDPQRSAAEEQTKRINEAFEAVRSARSLPNRKKTTVLYTPEPEVPEDTARRTRRRLETVESRVVVRNGKVIMVKRKRAVKYARLKELRDSARDLVLSKLDVIEQRLAERKAKRSRAQTELNLGRRVSRVIHIVEGKVRVESF